MSNELVAGTKRSKGHVAEEALQQISDPALATAVANLIRVFELTARKGDLFIGIAHPENHVIQNGKQVFESHVFGTANTLTKMSAAFADYIRTDVEFEGLQEMGPIVIDPMFVKTPDTAADRFIDTDEHIEARRTAAKELGIPYEKVTLAQVEQSLLRWRDTQKAAHAG